MIALALIRCIAHRMRRPFRYGLASHERFTLICELLHTGKLKRPTMVDVKLANLRREFRKLPRTWCRT
jgi:hypothetical protein